MTFLKWFLSPPRRAGGSSKGDWSPFEAAPPEAGKSVSAETLAALSGCRASARSLGVWGHTPPSAFGRAAASPQTRQMRCWPSSERTTNPASRRKRQDSLSLSLVLFPPKLLRWVSAGALLGEAIRHSRFAFFRHFCAGGWYHYPWRVLHAVETLGAQGTRWLNKLLVVYSLPVGSASAHSGSQGQTRGVFTT